MDAEKIVTAEIIKIKEQTSRLANEPSLLPFV